MNATVKRNAGYFAEKNNVRSKIPKHSYMTQSVKLLIQMEAWILVVFSEYRCLYSILLQTIYFSVSVTYLPLINDCKCDRDKRSNAQLHIRSLRFNLIREIVLQSHIHMWNIFKSWTLHCPIQSNSIAVTPTALSSDSLFHLISLHSSCKWGANCNFDFTTLSKFAILSH